MAGITTAVSFISLVQTTEEIFFLGAESTLLVLHWIRKQKKMTKLNLANISINQGIMKQTKKEMEKLPNS